MIRIWNLPAGFWIIHSDHSRVNSLSKSIFLCLNICAKWSLKSTLKDFAVCWLLFRYSFKPTINWNARAITDKLVVFSLLRRLSTLRYPHLLLSAGAHAAQHTCSYRSISPSHRALSSKPADRRYCCQSMEQTDGRTDWRTLGRYIDPAPHIVPAASVMLAMIHRPYPYHA